MTGSRTEIRLPDESAESRIIDRLVHIFRGRFTFSTTYFGQAGLLALYFYAIGNRSAARNLLEDITKGAKYTGDENLWGAIGDCIVLLSYVYEKFGDVSAASKVMDQIRQNEIMATDRERVDLVAECLSEHEKQMHVARSESRKYACEVIAGRVFEYLYFLESSTHIYFDLQANQVEALVKVIDESIETLAARLA